MDAEAASDRYRALLSGYATDGGARWLQQAAELGREMAQTGVPLHDVAAIHSQALDSLPEQLLRGPSRPHP